MINVPVGIAALIPVSRVVPESKGMHGARLDFVGMLLVTADLVALVLPLIDGREQGWPVWTWICLALSVVLLAVFAFYQAAFGRRGGGPLVDMTLFSERAFSAGLLTTLCYYAAMASFFLVLALYLQQGRGLSALSSGTVFLVLRTGFFASSPRAAAFAKALGRQALALGAVLVAGGYALRTEAVHAIGVGGNVLWTTPGLLIAGFGMGMVMAPLASLVLANVTPQHAASASGVLSTALQIGDALGVAVIGIVFYRALGAHPQGPDLAHAFVVSLVVLIGISVAAAVLVQFLRPRAARTA